MYINLLLFLFIFIPISNGKGNSSALNGKEAIDLFVRCEAEFKRVNGHQEESIDTFKQQQEAMIEWLQHDESKHKDPRDFSEFPKFEPKYKRKHKDNYGVEEDEEDELIERRWENCRLENMGKDSDMLTDCYKKYLAIKNSDTHLGNERDSVEYNEDLNELFDSNTTAVRLRN